MKFEVAVENFCSYLQKQRGSSEHTVSNYRRDLVQYFSSSSEEFGETVSELMKKEPIRIYLYSLSDLGRKPRTISRKRAALLSFTNYLLKQSIISTNPLASIVAPKADKPIPVMISENQAKELTETIPQTPKELRNRTIVELLYGTGIRLAELHGMSIRDISFAERTIKVLGKGNKERIVPVTDYALKLTEAYIHQRPTVSKDAPLIVNDSGERLSRRQIQRIVEKELGGVTDAKKRSPHILRHSYATHILDNGADIRVVKELLGHSSLASTQIYTHVTKDRLREAFRQAHPRSGE